MERERAGCAPNADPGKSTYQFVVSSLWSAPHQGKSCRILRATGFVDEFDRHTPGQTSGGLNKPRNREDGGGMDTAYPLQNVATQIASLCKNGLTRLTSLKEIVSQGI